MKLSEDRKRSVLARVGSYGCAGAGRGGARIVRVALADGVARAPRSAVVDCPACGERHTVKPTWRRPTPRDEGTAPEVVIGAAASDIASTKTD